MIAVDLFAGAGGFSTGAEMAGVRVAVAANHWPIAVDVHARNHPDTIHHCQDLRQFDFATLPTFDLLLASPSCQGHSRAGQAARAASEKVKVTHDEYRSTAWAVVDCLEVCRPRAAIVENVPEFLKWELFDIWLGALQRLGYTVTTQVLTASRWGVPQRRERAVIVCVHEGVLISLQDPDVSETTLEHVFDESASGWRSISAMKSTRSLKGHWTARQKVEYANAKLGGALGWGQHVNHAAWGMPLTEPVHTITTSPSQLWWVRDGMYRLWSMKEVARGMSFADDYDLSCVSKKADKQRLLGNAIPPLLARGVVSRVVAALTEAA